MFHGRQTELLTLNAFAFERQINHICWRKKTLRRVKVLFKGKVDSLRGNSMADGGTSETVGGLKRAISGKIRTINGFKFS